MTTTLRPTEPLQQHADGTRSRHYQVCVNSRPAGEIRLGTSPSLGPSVALVTDLRIDEGDRRRGRGTVAALAAEEVVRGWGCARIEALIPAGAEAARRLAAALGYTARSRAMAKHLGEKAPALPEGSRARPMTGEEFGTWRAAEGESYARMLMARGVPEAEAYAKSRRDHETHLPDGLATEGATFSVLEHEGTPVGTLWLSCREDSAHVFDVGIDEPHRGRGHGRSLLLLAEAQTLAAGPRTLTLNVLAGNTPAERLYESLGYETTSWAVSKPLL